VTTVRWTLMNCLDNTVPVRAVGSMRQTEALASVIFFVFSVISFVSHPKYPGRELNHGHCLTHNFNNGRCLSYHFFLATALPVCKLVQTALFDRLSNTLSGYSELFSSPFNHGNSQLFPFIAWELLKKLSRCFRILQTSS